MGEGFLMKMLELFCTRGLLKWRKALSRECVTARSLLYLPFNSLTEEMHSVEI